MPGWICGRLASTYRTLKRYDDEVELLERYRESQSSEEARTRFDARLSKARAVAERKRRPVTGALETVRQVRHRSSQRRRTPSRAQKAIASAEAAAARDGELRAALADSGPEADDRLRSALAIMCAEAHAAGLEMEHLVSRLKSAWTDTPLPPDLTPEDWQARYSTALVGLLALYFGEPA